MSEPLYSLAYVSHNAIAGGADAMRAQFTRILASARRNNRRCGVTGVLLFSDGRFAQVLEGPLDKVEAIFETIQRDPRHRELSILHLHAIAQRSFPAWSMAFGGIDGVSVDPRIEADAMATAGEILATDAGRKLLASLQQVLHRDDLARRRVGVGR